MINSLLCYVNTYISSSTESSIRKTILEFYNPSEISEAKALLWEFMVNRYPDVNLDPCKERRQDGTTRSKIDIEVFDIIFILKKADVDKVDVKCATTDLRRVPGFEPEENNYFSLIERIERLEKKTEFNTVNIHDLETCVKNVPRLHAENNTLQSTDKRIEPSAPQIQMFNDSLPKAKSYAGIASVTTNQLKRAESITSLQSATSGQFNVPTWQRRRERRNTKADERKQYNENNRNRNDFNFSGSGKRNDASQSFGASRALHLFVKRVRRDIDDESFKSYLTETGFSLLHFERLSKDESRFKSFRVSIPFEQKDFALDPANWDEGIVINKFRFPRSNLLSNQY